MLSLSETTLAFPLIPTLMMGLHCLIGLVAARTGYHRGGDLGQWLLWGILGGTVALITARYGDRLPLPLQKLNPNRATAADSRGADALRDVDKPAPVDRHGS